ncbi:MAG: TonB-dependent receptor [Methylovulum sp.]|nr:MAG: TonB-dependent receptor [Methylovulum sp.]
MNKLIAILFLSAGAIASNAYAEDADVQELDTIIVTAPFEKTGSKSARPVTVLSEAALRTKIGQTIGETLKNELGITSQSFGTGVGTPVIRGQSGPRVRVMQNGLGNNDASNLSPDHANSVEPILAERVEVLRGPSTLLYGSGAIGGVVNVIDNRIPETMPDKLLGGAAEQRYDSTSNESASTLKLEGGHSGVAYHLDGFYRGHDNVHIGGKAIDETAARATDSSLAGVAVLDNSDGVINNSNGRSEGASAGMSLIGYSGMVGAALNQLNNNYGIPPDGSGGGPVRIDMSQTKYELKAQLKNPLPLAEALRYKFGYTDYKHVEMDDGVPATTFLNESFENRVELEHKPLLGLLDGVLGFQSVNSQFAALGEEAVVPRSDIDTYGVFLVESLDFNSVTYELGMRGESVTIAPETGSDFSYTPLSGSASALWDITDRHQLSLSMTHSERAPQIQELLSDGVHEATRSYELGNADLKEELSNNLDLGYRYTSDWMTAQLNLFHNWVGDYIYQQRSGSVFNEDTETFETLCSSAACLPILESRQTDATFKGFEAQLTFPLMENRYGLVDLNLFSDYTRGEFSNGGNVPRMPPLRYGLQVSYEKNDWSSNIRLTRGEAQTYAGDNESNTPAYLLLNLGAQYRLANLGKAEVMLFANGKNLLDENIRNSTSYLRNFAPEPGRSAELGVRISY